MNTLFENPNTLAATLLLGVAVYIILHSFISSLGSGNSKYSEHKPKLYRLLEPFTRLFPSKPNNEKTGQTMDSSDSKLDVTVRQSGYYLTIQEVHRTQITGLVLGVIIGLLFGWFLFTAINDGGASDTSNPIGKEFFFFIVIPIIVGMLGYLLPLQQLEDMAEKRSKAIRSELPFAIDMFASSMDAGLEFSAAVRYYLNVMKGSVLNDEFALFLRDVELGKTRGEALRDMDRRLAVPEFSRFVHAIIYAMESGSPVIDIMRQQVEDIRREKFTKLEIILQSIEPKQEAIIAAISVLSIGSFLCGVFIINIIHSPAGNLLQIFEGK